MIQDISMILKMRKVKKKEEEGQKDLKIKKLL